MAKGDAIRALLSGGAAFAKDMSGSMRDRNAKRAQAEAALRQIAMQDAMHKAQLGKLDAETQKLLRVPERQAPQTINPGQGLLGPDGNYSVPIPRTPTPQGPPPSRTTDRGIEEYREGQWVVTGRQPFQRPVKQSERPLPSSAIEKFAGLDDLIASATNVATTLEQAIADGTNVGGRTLGMKTLSWVKNAVGQGGDKGKEARAIIGALFSDVAKQRGGTALSAQEIGTLETFLPNEHEDEATSLIKANRFIKTLKAMKANKLKAYQQYGGVTVGEEHPDDIEARLPNP